MYMYTKFCGYRLIGFRDFVPKNFMQVEVDTQLKHFGIMFYFLWYCINFVLVEKNVGVSG